MSRWRIVVVASLVLIPFLLLAMAGSYFMWQHGFTFYFWWVMAACMAVGYGLGWYWQSKQQLLRPIDFTPPEVSTERDQQAWKIIEAKAQAAKELPPEKFTNPQHYLNISQELAQELARFYHPRATDPVGGLTMPEILTVIELAAHDLGEMVNRYLPGGHLLTIQDFRRAQTAANWYRKASNVYWAVSAVLSPVSTAMRYAAARIGLSQPLQLLQQNLLLWFYTAFLHRLGTYLIELYSGRLRVGAQRWRELVLDRVVPVAEMKADETGLTEASQVTLTILGQVKVGKSSLINALLGEQKALADVLPATSLVERYRLQPADISTELILLDTPGYGHSGPSQDQVEATKEAAQQSDVLLLVLHARNPGREADLKMLETLRDWFSTRPDLKRPSVIGVLTHVDLLSPTMEWNPPYDWPKPKRPKEQNIHDAVKAVRDQLGEHLAAVVPVCTASGKVYGIDEGLLPAMTMRLEEGRAVAVLRCLHAERDTGKVRKVFDQFLSAGKGLMKVLWQGVDSERMKDEG